MQTISDLIANLSDYSGKALTEYRADKKISWSYPQLSGRVLKMAGGLKERGITEKDRVVITGENSISWLTAALGAIAAGASVVPLNYELDDKELAACVEDSDPSLIFADQKIMSRLEDLDKQFAEIYSLDPEEKDDSGWEKLLAEEPLAAAEIRTVDPVVIFYTSGTTGRPKGVPLTHENLMFSIKSVKNAEIVGGEDKVLLPLPLYHVYPFVVGTLAPMALGLPLVFPASLTGPDIIEALDENNLTVIIGVPRLYRALVEGIEERIASSSLPVRLLLSGLFTVSRFLRKKFNLRWGKKLLAPLHSRVAPQLRLLASGGAALEGELAWKLEGLGWEVDTGYGLTETSPLLTLNLSDYNNFEASGKPLPGVDLKIEPGSLPEEARENNLGEVLARGPNVFGGYRNLPDKTGEVFTEDGWFKTGDIGRINSGGFLFLEGRVSTLIVTESGKNVQPKRLEAIYGESELIDEIGILEKSGRLAALVVPDLDALRHRGESNLREGVETELRKIGRQLPEYQRIAKFEITRQEIPRTRLGKIRRHLLVERYEQAKDSSGRKKKTGTPLPVAEMEAEDQKILEKEAARRVWDWLAEKYSDLPLEPDSNFQLDLGVDSLQWVDFTLRIEELTGIRLTEEQIGQIETVRELLLELSQTGLRDTSEVEKKANPLENPDEFLTGEQKKWLNPRNFFHRLLAPVFYWSNRLLMKTFFGVQVTGKENLPGDENFILAPNHVSYFDAFFLGAALDYNNMHKTRWAAWREVAFSNPLFRLACRIAGAVPVDPLNNPASSLAYGEYILRKKWNLAWFPEGRRSPDGELQEFQPGLGILLKERETPVVPTRIKGGHEVLPPGRKLPRIHRVKVIFGEPVRPGELADEGTGSTREKCIVSALKTRVAALDSEN